MQRVVPATAFTEASFWLTSAMAFGMTAGNLAGGLAVDRTPPGGGAYLVTVAFGLVTAATVLAGGLRLPAEPAESVEPVEPAESVEPVEPVGPARNRSEELEAL
jgi:hypothetical protein